MAFYEQEDEKLDENGQPAVGGPSPVGGATLQGSNAPSNIPQSNQTPSVGNNFVGIQNYLNANKTQAAKLSDQVGSYVENVGDEARSTFDTNKNLYNQKVDENTINLDQNVFNEAKERAQNVSSDEGKRNTFINMRDAEYKGPSNLIESDYYTPVKTAYDKAQEKTFNTLNEFGQKNLIKDLQTNDTARINEGARTFDSMLLQADPGSRTRLEQARQKNADIQGLYDTLNTDAQQKGTTAKQTTDATRKAVQDAFTGEQSVQNRLVNDINTRVEQLVGAGKADQDRIYKALNDLDQLSESDLKKLGLTQTQYDELFNKVYQLRNFNGRIDALNEEATGLNKYFEGFRGVNMLAPEALINAQNAANAEEFARYAALNDLMNTQNQFLNDPTQAGLAPDDFIDINYNNAYDAVQAQILQNERIKKEYQDRRVMEKLKKIAEDAIGKNKKKKFLGIF